MRTIYCLSVLKLKINFCQFKFLLFQLGFNFKNLKSIFLLRIAAVLTFTIQIIYKKNESNKNRKFRLQYNLKSVIQVSLQLNHI